LVAGTPITIRHHMLFAAEKYGEKGVLTLDSKEARAFIYNYDRLWRPAEEAGSEFLDHKSIFLLFKVAAARADPRFFTEGFINRLVKLTAELRHRALTSGLDGTNFEKVGLLAQMYLSHRTVGNQKLEEEKAWHAGRNKPPAQIPLRT
jgi:hypothetical protein